MICRKDKRSIKKLISGTNLDHWSLALQILTSQLSRDNAESMVLQYIINTHSHKLSSKATRDVNNWIKEKITNEKLVNYFNRSFKPNGPSGLFEHLEQGSVHVHNGNLTLNELSNYFTSLITSRKQKNITLTCSSQMTKTFDELIKEEIK